MKFINKYSLQFILPICLFIIIIYFKSIYMNFYLNKSPFFISNDININKDLNNTTSFKNLIPNIENSAHSSSLLKVEDKLMVLYFAGSREGARDVKIYQSFLDTKDYNLSNSKWSTPKAILDINVLSKVSGKFIRKLGNPITFADKYNNIHMMVVGTSLGGWSTSRIYHFLFNNDLSELKYIDELKLGIFMNMSHLVRSKAVALEDGGFMLPVYHELIRKYPLMVFFDKDSKMLFSKRIINISSQLQPTIEVEDNSSCLAYFRVYKQAYDASFIQECIDYGNIWKTPIKTNIKNFDSSSILIGIEINHKKEILILHNDGLDNPNIINKKRDREALSLFWLKDKNNGIFERLLTLDYIDKTKLNGLQQEASYPSAQIDKNYLHITYTFDRKQIKHIALSLTAINELIKLAKNNEFQQVALDNLENYLKNKVY